MAGSEKSNCLSDLRTIGLDSMTEVGPGELLLMFHGFLSAMDKWEQDARRRDELPETQADPRPTREIWRSWIPSLHEALAPYCTADCIATIQEFSSLGSPSEYGLNGFHILECEIKGDKAKLTTRGTNKFPESSRRAIFTFAKVNGEWKIDGKKELSESGRQRKIALFE